MLSIMTIKVANAGIDDDVSSCMQAALRISTNTKIVEIHTGLQFAGRIPNEDSLEQD